MSSPRGPASDAPSPAALAYSSSRPEVDKQGCEDLVFFARGRTTVVSRHGSAYPWRYVQRSGCDCDLFLLSMSICILFICQRKDRSSAQTLHVVTAVFLCSPRRTRNTSILGKVGKKLERALAAERV